MIANSDRVALRNSRGGELFGPVMNHFIPPLIPGFEEAGGLRPRRGSTTCQSPTGDPELAAEYMKKAGFESGKCEGSECEITMVGDDAPPGRDTATVFQDQLEELGFKVSFQPVEHSLMYTKFCSIPSQQPDVCPNVGWIKDFNDPLCFFDIPLYGPAINPSNNSNWARLDDPEVNKAIEEATSDHRPGGTGAGLRRTGRPDHVSGPRRPMGVGQRRRRPVGGRERRGQHVQRPVRHQLHVAEVGVSAGISLR